MQSWQYTPLVKPDRQNIFPGEMNGRGSAAVNKCDMQPIPARKRHNGASEFIYMVEITMVSIPPLSFRCCNNQHHLQRQELNFRFNAAGMIQG
jgi:hypothetical protein